MFDFWNQVGYYREDSTEKNAGRRPAVVQGEVKVVGEKSKTDAQRARASN
jgi:hypothetical protein